MINPDHVLSDLVEDPHGDSHDLGNKKGFPWRRLRSEDVLHTRSEGEEENQENVDNYGEDGNLKVIKSNELEQGQGDKKDSQCY